MDQHQELMPNGWVSAPLKHLARLVSGGTPNTENELFWADQDGDNWVAIGDMSGTDLVVSTEKRITGEGRASARLAKGKPGTVLFAMYASVGAVSTLGIDASWNQAILGIEPLPGRADSKYLAYALKASADQLPFLYRSNTQNNLNSSQVGMLRVLRPPLNEQRQIAEYLDRETGKIDELIAKQEHLVGTLTERLESAWSERVDEIFERYPKMGVRRVINSIVDGPFGSSLTSAHYSDSGTRVIRLGNIGVFEFKSQDEAFIPDEYALELAAHSAMPGDVVVAGLGDDKMPLGRASVVPEGLGRAIVKADCYRVRPSRRVTAEYLAWMLSSPRLREQFRNLSRGSTRQRLNTTVVREAVIAVPSLEVQNLQIESFKAERAKLNALVSKAGEVAQILRERRAALISAAVTGKIEVRGL